MTTEITPGVCYGTAGDGFPSPSVFLGLCDRFSINKIRLYEPQELLLKALNRHPTQIEVTLGVQNYILEDLYDSVQGKANAETWVKDNVTAFQNVRFKCITVGDEVNPENINGENLVKAITNVKQAIQEAHPAGDQIKVSTIIDAEKALTFRYYDPPSKSQFRRPYISLLVHVLPKLAEWEAPLLVNVHPFRFYSNHRGNAQQDLEYAVFAAQQAIVQDGTLKYTKLFDAILDAFYWALERINTSVPSKIVVSESGWPTRGHDAATYQKAEFYNKELIRHVSGTEGTPKTPRVPIETYIRAIFDENGRPGSNFEKKWGIFEVPVHPDAEPKYTINFHPTRN